MHAMQSFVSTNWWSPRYLDLWNYLE